MAVGREVFFSAVQVQNTAEIHLWFGYQRDTVMFYTRGWFYILRYWPFLILITPPPPLPLSDPLT